MRLKTTALIAAMVMFLIGSGFAAAASITTHVTNNTYEDTFPQINGGYLVWQGHGNLPGAQYGAADWEVFLYNIATEVTTQITDNEDDDLNPQTDGRYIVWWSDKETNAEVWLYDIETGAKTKISPSDGNNHYLPVIANGRVAWLGFIRGEVILREIWLYDVSGGTPEQLTNNTLDESSPRISDQQLMWVQTDEEGNNSVFVHDFGTGATGPAPDNFIWEDSPQEDGTLRVSMSRDEQDWEIIIRNRDVKGFERITDNALDDRYPRISGNKIAWMAGEGKTREIFLAVYTCLVPLSPGDGAVLSGPEIATFTWVAIGYDKFKVKFSADPEFPTSGSLAFPPSEGSWLSETSLTPSEESWGTIRTMARTYGVVYWQVEGMSTEGSASYSETWSFTIYEGGVAATTTTGGGGDSGPCFIGTVAFD